MPDRRRRGNVIDIKIRRPPPGASAEERAAAYADALLLVENALSYFQDELSRYSEALLVAEVNAKRDQAKLEERLSHVELMLEAIMRSLSLDPATGAPISMGSPVPPMRDKMPTADDIKEAVEEAVESAIERRTPNTAFTVPGFSPWHPPPPPTGITSERARELIETKEVEEERDKLLENEKKRADEQKARADMFRNIIVGIVVFVGGPATIGLIYLIAKAIVGAH